MGRFFRKQNVQIGNSSVFQFLSFLKIDIKLTGLIYK